MENDECFVGYPKTYIMDSMFLTEASIRIEEKGDEQLRISFVRDVLSGKELPLQNYNYLSDGYCSLEPDESLTDMALEVCMTDWRNGSQRAREILVQIVKKIFPKEYRDVKRQREINEKVLMEYLDTDSCGNDVDICWREYIVIAELIGVPVSGMDDVINPDDDEIAKYVENLNVVRRRYVGIDENVVEKARKVYERKSELWQEDAVSDRLLKWQPELVGGMLMRAGYTVDMDAIINSFTAEPDPVIGDLLYTMFLVGEEPALATEEELMALYGTAYATANLINMIGGRDNLRRTLLLDDEVQPFLKDGAKAERRELDAEKKADVVKKEDFSEDSVSALRAENERLRMLIAKKDSDIQAQRDLYMREKEKNGVYQVMLGDCESVKQEAASLREFVWNLDKGELPLDDTVNDEETVRKTLSDKLIVIVGGRDQWQAWLKNSYPKWRFVQKDKFSSPDPSICLGADKVYIVPSTLTHAAYYKYISYLRDNHIGYGYLKEDRNVQEAIYKDMIGRERNWWNRPAGR